MVNRETSLASVMSPCPFKYCKSWKNIEKSLKTLTSHRIFGVAGSDKFVCGYTVEISIDLCPTFRMSPLQCCRGDTALYIAAQRGHKEVVQLLLEEGADVNAPTIETIDGLGLGMSSTQSVHPRCFYELAHVLQPFAHIFLHLTHRSGRPDLVWSIGNKSCISYVTMSFVASHAKALKDPRKLSHHIAFLE